MALKAGRKVDSWITDFIYDDTISADVPAGGVVAIKTTASGEGLDSSLAVCNYHSTGSGVTALGVLVPAITTDNVTTSPRNMQKNIVPKGSKVEIINKGWVVTNMYLGTPTAGAKAELAASGFVALGTQTQTVGNVLVGYFLSTPDEDNYVKLYVDCPSS
jgi:hypothetical protein